MVRHVHLFRHGETEWSASGRHTSRTDIPLSETGEKHAARWAGHLGSTPFSAVFVSPRQRAVRTCELMGCVRDAVVEPELVEWDYGEYEGLRSAEILQRRPGWNLFADGCPVGESPGEISGRADRVIARLLSLEGEVALFSHGHFGRVLGARWMRLPVTVGARLEFSPAARSILGFEHDDSEAPVLFRWNELPPA